MSSKPQKKSPENASGLNAMHSRRSFLKGMGMAAGATMVAPALVRGEDAKPADAEKSVSGGVEYFGAKARKITLNINGKAHTVSVEPRATLLEVLRDHLEMTASKEVCDRGTCGCCGVLVDRVAVTSCMMLAMDAEGREILTAEGIGAHPRYKNLIDGLCECDAAQCGFCIPGFLVRSAALLEENPKPTREEIREGLAGNLCRCGTYQKIFEGIEAAVAKGGLL